MHTEDSMMAGEGDVGGNPSHVQARSLWGHARGRKNEDYLHGVDDVGLRNTAEGRGRAHLWMRHVSVHHGV